jgi:sulfite oxidase
MTVEGKRADMIVHQTEPLNAESPRAALASGDLTGLATFYVRSHGPTPSVDPRTWRLRVCGLVRRELSLSVADLRAGFDEHTLIATLQCAGNRREGFMAVR